MEYRLFTRKPFDILAIQITKENMDEVAEKIGDIAYKDEGRTKYIVVNQKVVPNIARAYVGWWITNMNDNLRCYSPKVFAEQFVERRQKKAENPIDQAVEQNQERLEQSGNEVRSDAGFERLEQPEEPEVQPVDWRAPQEPLEGLEGPQATLQ